MTGQLEATLEEKLGESWRRPGDERTVVRHGRAGAPGRSRRLALPRRAVRT